MYTFMHFVSYIPFILGIFAVIIILLALITGRKKDK